MIVALALLLIGIVGGAFVIAYKLTERENEKHERDYFFSQNKAVHQRYARRIENEIKRREYTEDNKEDLEKLYQLYRKFLYK